MILFGGVEGGDGEGSDCYNVIYVNKFCKEISRHIHFNSSFLHIMKSSGHVLNLKLVAKQSPRGTVRHAKI